MRGRFTRFLLPPTALALTLAIAPAASAGTLQVHDPVPITPNVYFEGVINNHPPGSAVIAVACAAGSTTGKPVKHQTIEAESIPPPTSTSPDVGYTGSKGKSVNASLALTPATGAIAHFTSFFAPKFIPTSITVPCSGAGAVDFVPAPTSKTAKTAVLSVTFVASTTG
jgi:hypothetical protein